MLLLELIIKNRFLIKNSKYIFVLLAGLLIISCKKQNSTMGTEVQPESDGLLAEQSDTATIQIHTIKHPKTRSYQDQYKYLGSNQDPVFGRTNASIFTNFSLPNGISNISFGEDAVLDSAELILTFTQSFVGDSTTPLQYQVHQLTQSLDKNAAYYLDTTLTYNASMLSNVSRRITKTSGFYTVRLPIESSYAAAVLNNPQYLVDNTTLHSTYKGFFITTRNTNNLNPTSNQGALMKMDLDNAVSGFYVYYHNGSSSASKTPKQYKFQFSGDNASRFNNIEFNYLSGGNTTFIQQITGDSAKGKQNIFLKGVGGTKAVLRLPHLKNYSDSCPIAVNRAELVLKVDPTFANTIGTYDAPPQISLVAMDAAGKEIYVKDQFYSSDLLKFGGTYDATNKQYVFNISRHVQDIVSGKLENYGFYIVVAYTDKLLVPRRDLRAERVILGGINNLLYAPKFTLTFVRFPYDK